MTMMMPPMGLKKPHRCGFTLTELAIVLGVIGLVLGAIWAAASTVYTNKMVNDEVSDMTAIVQNIRDLYVTRQNFVETDSMSDITLNLVSAGVFNNFPLNSAGRPLNREGGVIKVEAVPNFNTGTLTPDNTEFEIEFFGTPQTCTKLLSILANTSPPYGPIYVYAAGVAPGWFQTGGGDLSASTFAGCTYASFAYTLH